MLVEYICKECLLYHVFKSPVGVGEKIRRVEARKLMGRDKDNSMGKATAPCAQAKQNKEFMHGLPLAGRCSSSSGKAGLHHTWQ